MSIELFKEQLEEVLVEAMSSPKDLTHLILSLEDLDAVIVDAAEANMETDELVELAININNNLFNVYNCIHLSELGSENKLELNKKTLEEWEESV